MSYFIIPEKPICKEQSIITIPFIFSDSESLLGTYDFLEAILATLNCI